MDLLTIGVSVTYHGEPICVTLQQGSAAQQGMLVLSVRLSTTGMTLNRAAVHQTDAVWICQSKADSTVTCST